MILHLLVLLCILNHCDCASAEIHLIPVRASKARKYCGLTNKQLAVSDNEEATQLCLEKSETKQCIVEDVRTGKVVILDATTKQIEEPIGKCNRPVICVSQKLANYNADDIPRYTDEYNGYEFDPELVCMQYQYYVAISALIMICFATFICLTFTILNKIKDHQTMVHVRI
eukprot:UN10344